MFEIPLGRYAKQLYIDAMSAWCMNHHMAGVILERGTPLKDVNGVTVFEGDVVKYKKKEYTIVFDGFAFYLDRKGNRNNLLNEDMKLEICGNVNGDYQPNRPGVQYGLPIKDVNEKGRDTGNSKTPTKESDRAVTERKLKPKVGVKKVGGKVNVKTPVRERSKVDRPGGVRTPTNTHNKGNVKDGSSDRDKTKVSRSKNKPVRIKVRRAK